MMNSLKRKTSLFFFSSLACFTWASSVCFSLPSKPAAKSGSVQIEYVGSHTMIIKASDGAILQYDDFQIGPEEEVRFMQSANACVYHNIKGSHSTQILGSIQSSGKVVLIQESGVVLSPEAKIQVPKLQIESPHIDVRGSIDATSPSGKGGEVHLFGKEIVLQGAKIDVSGLLGGGEVLIGGEFQGQGTTPYASKVFMDASSQIWANARDKGDGGLVVLWSQDQTVFEGKIFARSGSQAGAGGLVETSSKGILDVFTGKVDTWGTDGNMGQWLLDPKYVYIVSSGSASCASSTTGGTTTYGDLNNSGSCTLPASVFSNLTSNVVIQACCGAVIKTSFDVTTAPDYPKANLTFQVCANEDSGCTMQFPKWSWDIVACVQIYDSNHSSGGGTVKITTDGGSITFPNTYYSITTIASLEIDTNGGSIDVPSRAFAYVDNLTLTLDAGTTGIINFKTITGNVTGGFFRGITINNASYVGLNSSVQLAGSFLSKAPIHIQEGASCSISTTGSSYVAGTGDINISGGVEGPGALGLNAGSTGKITVGSVGMTTPLPYFTIGSGNAASVSLLNGVHTTGDISISIPLSFTGNDTSLKTAGGNITVSSSCTFSGSNNSFTVDAGLGSVNIPAIPSFNTISVGGGIVTIGGGLSSSENITLSHSGTATINGTISAGGDFQDKGTGSLVCSTVTSSKGSLSFTGSPTLNGTFTAQTSISFASSAFIAGTFTAGTSISSAGSLTFRGTSTLTAPTGISIGSQIDSDGSGNYDLSLVAGDGSISVGGNITNIRSFTVTSASAVSLYGITTLGGQISIPCPVTVLKGGGVISSGGGDVILGGLIYPYSSNVDVDLVINTTSAAGSLGAISVQGLGNATYPFKTISMTGSNISLGKDSNVMAANGPLYISGALGLSGNTILQGTKGITLAGTISFASSNLDLTLDSGTYPLTIPGLGSSSAPLGNLSITASNLILGGDLYTSSSIQISSPITISANTTLSSLSGYGGITLLGPVTTSSGNPSLTLQANSGPLDIQSLGSANSPLGDLSLTGSYITLNGDIMSSASMNLAGPITTTKSLTFSAAQGIILNQDLVPNMTSLDLTLQATGGSVVAQNLGTDTNPLKNISILSAGPLTPKSLISTGNISLSGTTITLGSTISASGTITIANTDLLTIPSGSMNLSGNFSQTGSGNVLLGMSLATSGSIAFSGDVTLSGSTTLQGTKGITITGTLAPSSGAPSLTLDAGTNPLTVKFGCTSSNPFGAVSIMASNLTMQGDVYSNTSILIDPSITISSDTTLSSLSGYGGITLLGPVTTSASNPNLTLQAASGPLDIQSLGSSSYPLGTLSLTGSYITLNGDITSAASMNVSGSMTITKSLTVTGMQGITLQQDLVPSTAPFDLTLQATGGSVIAQNLGTDAHPLKNISILSAGPVTPKNLISTGNISLSGTTITLGSKMSASGDISIANTDLLTISSGSLNFLGNFSQTGSGNVFLGMSMVTSGSLGFSGNVTLTGSTTLQGSKGVTISGTLAPSSGSPSLTLDSGTNPLTVKFASSKDNSFGELNIMASNLILQGDVYSNTSITIDPPISISSDTIFDSLSGYGGVLLLGPITASNGNPSLTVKAAKGPADVDQLGNNSVPLGDVSITGGTYIHLGGDIVSLGSLVVTGSINITDSRVLVGADGITLNNDLIPSTTGFNLTLQTCDTDISTRSLGKSGYPLQTVSLTCSAFDLLGSMTVGTVIFNGEPCSSGNWPSGTYTSCPASTP